MRIVALLVLALLPALAQQPPAQQRAAAPAAADVRVDYFGAEKGYAVAENQVTMLCVLRNIGNADLAANSLRVRCYALAGLDYIDGELAPLVPPLASHQAVTFRWRLQPTDRTTPIVASVLLTKVDDKSVPPVPVPAAPHGPSVHPAPNVHDPQTTQEPYVPKAVVAAVPHLAGSTPDMGVPYKTPSASSGADSARIGNDHISLRIAAADGHRAVGLLSAKSPDGWETVGVAWPLVRICSSVDGQSPWWRGLHWSHSEAHVVAGSSTLTLYGTCGEEWEVQITLDAVKDSGVLNGRVRLKARKTCRLFDVQLPRLTSPSERSRPTPSADGSATLVVSNPSGDDADNLAAAHRGNVTAGVAWTARSPLPDWLAFPLPVGDTDHTVQLGMQWNGGDKGEVVLPGGILDFTFRIFCISPSDTARDAHRIVTP